MTEKKKSIKLFFPEKHR